MKTDLRQDYDRGTSRVAFGDPPEFKWVLAELQKIQDTISAAEA